MHKVLVCDYGESLLGCSSFLLTAFVQYDLAGKNEVKPMGSQAVPDREQLLQILNKINALPLPMDLVSKLNNIGSLARKNLDQPMVNPQNDTNGASPSTMDLLAVLSATLGSSSPDALAILSQGGFGNKDSDKTKLSSYDNGGATSNLEKETFGLSSVGAERSSSSNQSPSQDSDSRGQDTRSSLSLQLFTSSPEDESRPTVASSRKYYSSDSSNLVEDRSPSSSPVMQELFPLQTSPETTRSENHTNTRTGGCLPLDLFGTSNRGAANPNFKGSGQQSGYASSGSDCSPPSLNSDAQVCSFSTPLYHLCLSRVKQAGYAFNFDDIQTGSHGKDCLQTT